MIRIKTAPFLGVYLWIGLMWCSGLGAPTALGIETPAKDPKAAKVDKNKQPTPAPKAKTPDPNSPKDTPVKGAETPAPQAADADTSVHEIDISCPYAQYEWKDGKQVCADWRFSSYNNAEDIAKKFDQAIAGIGVKAIDKKRLLITWKGKAPQRALAELEKLIQDHAETVGTDADENHIIRLYNSRNADKVATAIKGTFPDIDAGAAADDVIFLKGNPTDAHSFSNVDRLVARLDLPRPGVTLNVWSLQLSSKDPVELDNDSHSVQEQVDRYNGALENALAQGWHRLSEQWGTGPSTPTAKAFHDYIAKVDIKCGPIPLDACRSRNQSPFFTLNQDCAQDHYCLGFKDAFDLTTPSLTRMLLILASTDNPDKTAKDVVDEMEKPTAGYVAGDPQLVFTNFKTRLSRLTASSKELGALRAAYADFLYTYKWSVSYSNDFVPYELPTSASNLDSQLEPFMSALNQDVATYLEKVQKLVREDLVKKKYDVKKQLYSTGMVSVRAISGLSSEVDTKTASFFDATPPVTVNDVAKGLKDAETNMPAAVSGNLGAHAAAALMAGLSAEKPAVARVGRALTFKATPVSLITASAAELDVTLEASEDGDNQVFFKDAAGTKQVDDTSRVAQHKVATHVRVESMKLFELSSFSASLRRKNRTFPLIPPFVELPYIGSLVRIPLASDPTFHRSFAIAGAIVVPTAADLAFGIPFVGDRIVVLPRHATYPTDICLYDPEPPAKPRAGAAPEPPKERTDLCPQNRVTPHGPPDTTDKTEKYVFHRVSKSGELNAAVRPYHKRMVECFKDWQGWCGQLSYDTVESEER